MGQLLEKIYPHVPIWAQNLGVSLYGLSYRRERLGKGFDEDVQAFRERELWDSQKFVDYLERNLGKVLRKAFNEVAFYQKRWAEVGVVHDDFHNVSLDVLRHLPITTKEDLRRSPEAFVCSSSTPRKLVRYQSSGSTGTPVSLICTPQDHRRFMAAREARSFGWAATSIKNPRAMIGGRLVVSRADSKPPFYRYNAAENQVYFSAYHLSPKNVPGYVDGLNRYQPHVLTGYANSYYLLAQMMLKQGVFLNYKPRALVLSSEKLTSEMKDVMMRAFGARAYEEYGAVENCLLGSECEQGNLHISPDFGVVEIVDQHGRSVPPGREGRILCTGLVNQTQLLIRYEIGDIGVWSDRICGCGRRNLPLIKEIVARLEDVATGPGGRQLVRFHGIFIGLKDVLEGQVIQETIDTFRVKVVTTEGLGESDKNRIHERFIERLGTVNVLIEEVSELPRTERGKFRAVICNLTPEQKRAALGYEN
jgi:phenylacetate-CoA ligase